MATGMDVWESGLSVPGSSLDGLVSTTAVVRGQVSLWCRGITIEVDFYIKEGGSYSLQIPSILEPGPMSVPHHWKEHLILCCFDHQASIAMTSDRLVLLLLSVPVFWEANGPYTH
jgi:hypothetical protein